MLVRLAQCVGEVRRLDGSEVDKVVEMSNAGLVPAHIVGFMALANYYADPRPILECLNVLAELGFSFEEPTKRWVLRLNSRAGDTQISVNTAGFMMHAGAAVHPQPVTIGGVVFRVMEHMDRIAILNSVLPEGC